MNDEPFLFNRSGPALPGSLAAARQAYEHTVTATYCPGEHNAHTDLTMQEKQNIKKKKKIGTVLVILEIHPSILYYCFSLGYWGPIIAVFG